MQFMMSMFEPAEDFARRTGEGDYWPAWAAYSAALREAGVLVGGNALKAPETATQLRLEDGRARIEDGPFAEGREQLGGYYIIEVATLDEALGWAARAPCATTGGVEIRPVLEM